MFSVLTLSIQGPKARNKFGSALKLRTLQPTGVPGVAQFSAFPKNV